MPNAPPLIFPGLPKLFEQVRARLRVKHHSIRTGEAYADWIKRFILFRSKHHPRVPSAAVEVFVTPLAQHFVRTAGSALATQQQFLGSAVKRNLVRTNQILRRHPVEVLLAEQILAQH